MPDTVIAYVTHVDRPNISSASNRQEAKWRGGACLSKNGCTFCGCCDKCHRSGHDKRSTTKHKHASFTAHRETIQSRLKVKNDRCIAVSSFLDISVHCSLPGNKRQVSGAITLAAVGAHNAGHENKGHDNQNGKIQDLKCTTGEGKLCSNF